MERLSYDLELFLELNEEYAEDSGAQAQVEATRQSDADRFTSTGKRLERVDRDLKFQSGMRVLEIGCGRGHLGAILKREYGCEVVGVDIRTYPDWDEFLEEGIDLRIHDISEMENDSLGVFDRIVSLAVWEHIEHPYAALSALKGLLRPGEESLAYVQANLYRGTKASHRYRDVYFPWPHLLFEDDVFVEFYKGRGRRNVRAAWVNRLTVAHYERYVRQLDFEVVRQWTTGTPIDEGFYERFIERLGRYPRYDLEQDFIYLVLGHRKAPQVEPRVSPQVEPRVSPRVGLGRRVVRRLRRVGAFRS